MVDLVFYFGILCGFVALISRENGRWVLGNATAIPLLISAAIALILDANSVPFNFFFCVGVDLVVSVIICRNLILNHEPVPYNDMLVLALFPTAWTFYVLADGWLRLWGSTSVVVVQFLLCIPWNRIAAGLRSFITSSSREDNSLKFSGEVHAAFAKFR